MDIVSAVSHSLMDSMKESVGSVGNALKIHPFHSHSHDGDRQGHGHDEAETKVDVNKRPFAGRKGVANTANYMYAPRIVYKGHKQSVISLGMLRIPGNNETLVLSGSEDKYMKVWSLITGKLLCTLSGHKQRVSGVVGYADDSCPPVAISASADDTLRIWPMETCFEEGNVDADDIFRRSIPLHGFRNRVLGITALRPPDSDPVVAACSADNTIQVWSLPKGESLYTLVDKSEVTWNLCLTSLIIPQKAKRRIYGAVFCCGCKNNIVRIWRAHEPYTNDDGSSKPDKVIRNAHTSAVQSIAAFYYDHTPYVVTSCKDLDIRVFSIDNGHLMKSLKGHQANITSVAAACPTNERVIIVSSSVKGSMHVWKYTNDENDVGGELLRIFNGHTDEIYAVESFVTPEPDKYDIVIVSGSKDQSLRTWLFVDEKNDNLRIIDPKLSATPDNQHERVVRINAMDVYSVSEDAWIITGGDDGFLRMWCIRQDDVDFTDDLKWSMQAHETLVVAVALYVPVDDVVNMPTMTEVEVPDHLREMLIFSGGRDGCICITDFKTGKQVCPLIVAHPSPITSLCVFAGRGSLDGFSDNDDTIMPFLVSGSEDNCAKVWSLIDNSCHYVLEGLHDLDVTAVAVFLPRPPPKLGRKDMVVKARTPKGMSASNSPINFRPLAAAPGGMSMSMMGRRSSSNYRDPLIITGSEDTSVCIWSYQTGELLETLTESPAIITALTVIEPPLPKSAVETDPIVAAGNVEGAIFIWSLRPPYKLRHMFTGHTDEISTLDSFDVEGLYPVLVSGSLDTTLRIWNLKDMSFHRTIEGHTDDVMAVKIFKSGASDPALASGSVDCTVRVLFDFLGSVQNFDIVLQEFKYDLEGTNSHILTYEDGKSWPRISHRVKTEGAEIFFKSYYRLFGQALRAGRSDFLVEFLPLTFIGLLKSNSEMEDGDADDGRGGLLRQAINLRDPVAVRVLVDCWCTFLTKTVSGPTDVFYDPCGVVCRDDMLLLSMKYPKEFEKLVCSVKLMPTQHNSLPNGALFLSSDKDGAVIVDRYEGAVDLYAVVTELPQRRSSAGSDRMSGRSDMYAPSQRSDKQPSASNKNRQKSYSIFLKGENNNSGKNRSPNTSMRSKSSKSNKSFKKSQSMKGGGVAGGDSDDDEELHDYHIRTQKFLYLPIEDAVHMEMLKAYVTTCEKLDSVKIFDSEAGQLALSYAWHTFGIRAYRFKMYVYFVYVAISTTSTLTFGSIRHDYWYISLFLIIVQLCINGYFIRSEAQQYLTGIIEYLVDIWNFFDFSVIMGSSAANVLRIVYWEDTQVSRILLCITSIFMWFNILYYLRAFEETGPLVSMVLKISDDMKYLMLIVFLVLVGFSTAFFLTAANADGVVFSRMDRSLIMSFTFMVGDYDPFAFEGSDLEEFAVFLSAIYMMIVSILLLNLLIAFMADSYSAVKQKGLAQWKLQQAQIIKEMQGSMSEEDRQSKAVIYFRKQTEDNIVGESKDDSNGNPTTSTGLDERCSRIESAIEDLKSHFMDHSDKHKRNKLTAKQHHSHRGGSHAGGHQHEMEEKMLMMEGAVTELKIEMSESATGLKEELAHVSQQQSELATALRDIMRKLDSR